MFIMDFLKGFVPRLQARDLKEELRLIRKELDVTVIPCFEVAQEHFRVAKFKSAETKKLSDSFYKSYDEARHGKGVTFITDINKALKLIRGHLDVISNTVDTLFTRDTVVEGINAKQATTTRLISSITWLSRFSTDLLNYVYSEEQQYLLEVTAKKNKSSVSAEDDIRLSKTNRERIQKDVNKLAYMLNDLGIPTDTFVKTYTNIPEVILNKRDAGVIESHYQNRQLDPFYSPGLNGFIGNPIFHIGIAIAEWQNRRYRDKEDRLKVLQLRLLHLKTTEQDGNNAALQQQIEYLQKRIDILENDLREYEESVK